MSEDPIVTKLLPKAEHAVSASLGHLRRIEPDAASDVDEVRRAPAAFPSLVIVGETKRGKSSLTNALLDSPNLSPVDASVATSAYLEFRHGSTPEARAMGSDGSVSAEIGIDQLRDWGTVLGTLPEGVAAPRHIEITHPAALLRYITVIDTPGVGGLDSLHAEISLDAVSSATALLFVVDASAPFSQPELDFLSRAAEKVNSVFFALTKIDAYPGWRKILDDNKELLQAHAPRFAQSPFFPVSAQLAELSKQLEASDEAAAKELWKESKLAPLRGTLGKVVSGRAGVLRHANLLRCIRSEFVTLDTVARERQRAVDPDPSTLEQLKEERSTFAARKRKDARTWTLTLSTETRRARTDITGRLRTQIAQVQENYMQVIENASNDRIKGLPQEIDSALQAVSLRISSELEQRFRNIGGKVLAEVFTQEELHVVLGRLNARLQAAVQSKPQRDAGGDNLLALASVGGMGMMAGRAGSMGAAAALSSTAIGGLAIPVIGVGFGLAAGAFMLWRRKKGQDRQGAKMWLREVLMEARASISDEIAQRLTDLELALTLALDEAVERRVQQLDDHIKQIDTSMAQDKASRSKRKAAIQAERDKIRGYVKQLDEVLTQLKTAATTPPQARKPAATKPPSGG